MISSISHLLFGYSSFSLQEKKGKKRMSYNCENPRRIWLGIRTTNQFFKIFTAVWAHSSSLQKKKIVQHHLLSIFALVINDVK